MALQDILKKILAKSDQEVEVIKADFEAKKQVLETDSKEIELQELANLNRKTATALEAVEAKIESMARRENSKVLLEAKQKLIKLALQKFQNSLEKAEDDVYGKVIEKLFNSILDTKGTVLVPKNRLTISQKVTPKHFDVEADDSIKGGFVLKCKNGEVDNSFENLVQSEYKSALEMYFVESLKLI